MGKTYQQITRLKESGVVISPYVEIGVERGQRSLIAGDLLKTIPEVIKALASK